MIGLRRARPDEQTRVEAFQRAAYARTEAVVGARAIPLEWDYAEILNECEVWLDDADGALAGVLILRLLPDCLFLESIATAPENAGTGHGRMLMDAAHARARELDLPKIKLITNGLNPALHWYMKVGFVVDREEYQASRRVVHMSMDAR